MIGIRHRAPGKDQNQPNAKAGKQAVGSIGRGHYAQILEVWSKCGNADESQRNEYGKRKPATIRNSKRFTEPGVTAPHDRDSQKRHNESYRSDQPQKINE